MLRFRFCGYEEECAEEDSEEKDGGGARLHESKMARVNGLCQEVGLSKSYQGCRTPGGSRCEIASLSSTGSQRQDPLPDLCQGPRSRILGGVSSDTVAVLFALSAAISWGFSSIYVRLAQQYMPTSIGTFVSLVTGVAFAGALVLVFERDAIGKLRWDDAAVFAVIGIFNFPLGRFMNYLSIKHLGIGRSTPILASVPLFASLVAVLAFGEDIGVANIIGTALVLSGIYVTLRAPTAASVRE
jgi:drug/metabolite transporter (DMT)-like permease